MKVILAVLLVIGILAIIGNNTTPSLPVAEGPAAEQTHIIAGENASSGVTVYRNGRKSVGESAQNGVHSESQVMSFEACNHKIRSIAGELGMAPTNIVETNILRMVRFSASDGSVLVTCSALDNKMVLTRSDFICGQDVNC